MPKEKVYECEVKQWVADSATGKNVLRWVVMPVDAARNRAPQQAQLEQREIVRGITSWHG